MRLHLNSIIPLTVGLILLMIGLHLEQSDMIGARVILSVSGAFMGYGLVIHSNTLRAIRRSYRRHGW